MKLVYFKKQEDKDFRFGLKTSSGILDVAAAAQVLGVDCPRGLEELMSQGEAGRQALEKLADQVDRPGAPAVILAEAEVQLGPCVPRPPKIICVGLNYRQHAIESGMAVPTTPVLFSKFNTALAACGEAVPLAANAIQYDYEAELVAVIGKQARYVSQEAALDYVFGYCNGDDFSARDLQTRTTQWLLGKTPDKFMPIGPFLLTADEFGDPQTKSIRCWLNGELRQNSNTGDMVFSVAQLVSYISQYMTLEPGDLISTGTPQGVILGMKEKVWVKPGDVVEIEVEGLGRLVNGMTVEA